MARILGLDIGRDSVRGALLRTALRNREVERYLEVPVGETFDAHATLIGVGGAALGAVVPEGDAVAGEGEAPPPMDPVEVAILELIADCGTPPDAIITSMHGSFASLRLLTLPSGVVKRIGEVLPFELESILPFDIDETILDHQIVELGEEELRVLAGAAPREKVAAHLEEMKGYGVDPKHVGLGAASLDGLTALVPSTTSAERVLLVEIGAETSDLCFLEGGVCAMARTVSGGMDLVESGKRELLASTLRRTLAAYMTQGEEEPDVAFVLGRVASVPGAREWLGSVLRIETRTLPLPPVPGADDERRPQFGRAVALAGLSIRAGHAINMRQGEFAWRRGASELRHRVPFLAACAALVLFSYFFFIYARYSVLEGEGQRLESELAALTEQVFGQEVSSPTRARELLEGGVSADDPMPRFDAFDVLDAISAAIPEEITHDTRRLSIEIDDEGGDGRFEIQGSVASISERDVLVERLAAHECFQDIDKGATSPRAGGAGGLNYRLEVDILCPGSGIDDEEEER